MFRVFQQNRAVLAGTAAATAAVTYFIVRPKQHPDRIVIVGGGTAGIGVAAMLQNEGEKDSLLFAVHWCTLPIFLNLIWIFVSCDATKCRNEKCHDHRTEGYSLLPAIVDPVRRRCQECERQCQAHENGSAERYRVAQWKGPCRLFTLPMISALPRNSLKLWNCSRSPHSSTSSIKMALCSLAKLWNTCVPLALA